MFVPFVTPGYASDLYCLGNLLNSGVNLLKAGAHSVKQDNVIRRQYLKIRIIATFRYNHVIIVVIYYVFVVLSPCVRSVHGVECTISGLQYLPNYFSNLHRVCYH
jgi:hypothetical protein